MASGKPPVAGRTLQVTSGRPGRSRGNCRGSTMCYHCHRRRWPGVIGLDAEEYDKWWEGSRKGTVKVV